MEYKFATNAAFPMNEDGSYGSPSVEIKEGTIVINVVPHEQKDDAYMFMVKETEQRFCVEGGYVLWENTSENRKKIEEFKDLERGMERLKKLAYHRFEKIDKL